MGKGTRWFLFLVGLFLGFIGLLALPLGLVAAAIESPGYDASQGYVAAAVGLAFLASGCLLVRAVFPTVSAVAGAVSALGLVILAEILVVVAVVVNHVSTVDLDPRRASLTAWMGVALCVTFAALCAANWWHWLRMRGSPEAVRRVKQWLAILYGSVTFLGGLATGVSALSAALSHANLASYELTDLTRTLALAGSAAISLAAGTILVWHGSSSLSNVPSDRVRVPPWALLLLAALAAIALGEALIQTDTAVVLIPLAHVVAVLLPGLAILAMAARGLQRLPAHARATWRELLTMWGYGAAGAASIAVVFNYVNLVGAALIALAARGAFDGMRNSSRVSNSLDRTSPYLSQTDLLIILLIVIAVLVPFNEEFWKGFGVRLLRGSRPTRYQALLFGVAAGVAFGAVEANQYGTGAFSQSAYRWWDAMLLRGGASSLHALASGIVGLGWYHFALGQRKRALALYLLAVGMHGSWNALNVLASARVFPGFRDLSNHNLGIALEVAVGVLALGVLFMLWKLSGSLAQEELEEVRRNGPPATLEPQLAALAPAAAFAVPAPADAEPLTGFAPAPAFWHEEQPRAAPGGHDDGESVPLDADVEGGGPGFFAVNLRRQSGGREDAEPGGTDVEDAGVADVLPE